MFTFFQVLLIHFYSAEHFYCDKGINFLESVFSVILLMIKGIL